MLVYVCVCKDNNQRKRGHQFEKSVEESGKRKGNEKMIKFYLNEISFKTERTK